MIDTVLALFPNDCYAGQAQYPDWDETYCYDSYLNSYCILACSLEDNNEELREYFEFLLWI